MSDSSADEAAYPDWAQKSIYRLAKRGKTTETQFVKAFKKYRMDQFRQEKAQRGNFREILNGSMQSVNNNTVSFNDSKFNTLNLLNQSRNFELMPDITLPVTLTETRTDTLPETRTDT